MKTENLAILFTDIVGFTEATAQQSRQENAELLANHNQILLPVIRRFGGRLVKMIGDALLIVFSSPTDAMLCAMALQDSLYEFNRSVADGKEIHIRIAASLGEVRVAKKDIFGEPVNITSRIESITPQDEIYFSDAIYMAMNKAEVPCVEVGIQSLKGISEPVRVWQIPRFSRPRLVPEDVMDSVDIGELAYPYGGAHLLNERKYRKKRLGGFKLGRNSVSLWGAGLIGLLIVISVAVFFTSGAQLTPTSDQLASAPQPASKVVTQSVVGGEKGTIQIPDEHKTIPVPSADKKPKATAVQQGNHSAQSGKATPQTADKPRLDPATEKLVRGLNSKSSETRRRTIKTIARSRSHNAVLLDVVEKTLLQGYNKMLEDRHHIDAIAWMCKVLAASGNKRYKKSLDKVAANAMNSKIKRYAEKTSAQLN